MLGLAAMLILHCRQLGSYPETGFEEINCDLPEADFWPGMVSDSHSECTPQVVILLPTDQGGLFLV
jgi:hypothetical protein